MPKSKIEKAISILTLERDIQLAYNEDVPEEYIEAYNLAINALGIQKTFTTCEHCKFYVKEVEQLPDNVAVKMCVKRNRWPNPEDFCCEGRSK